VKVIGIPFAKGGGIRDKEQRIVLYDAYQEEDRRD